MFRNNRRENNFMNQDKQLNSKGQFGTRFGFLMSAIGSAVGLGNLWGFPYKMGAYGGFAFLVLYLILVIFVGYVIMLTELSLGRRTGKGVIEAYKAISKKYAFIGWMGLIAPYCHFTACWAVTASNTP